MPQFQYRTALSALLLLSVLPALVHAQKKPIEIVADLTDAPRKLYHAEVDLPVTPGPLVLTTPRWIPGNHRPTGPLSDITGVVFSVDGKAIEWRRDDVDLYQFHINIPQGVATLHAHLDCIVTGRVTQKMAVLEWEKLVLYPANTPVRDISIQASLKVPSGWGVGTALQPVTASSWPVPAAGSTTKFAATTVEQLEDSPIITGQNFREFELAPTIKPKHYIDVVSDLPGDQNLRPSVIAALNNLVREADAEYASHHYNTYHFLLTLSDIAGGEGLEHGQSSNNGVGEKGFADEAHQLPEADLLSHEFTHSWNGKYRRPVGLYQPDFATPQQGALLWVYEGMTQYLGNVLAARAGLKSQAHYRDMLAMSAANLDYKPGRDWRSTGDTAIAASILRGGNPAWSNWRRGQDYYQEGELLWLDVDTLIRSKTKNKKSLDDFERIFLAKGGNTGPLVVTYTLDELVQDLNLVMPYDWATFLHERVDKVHPRADLAGIEQGGYKLVYREKPNPSERIMNAVGGRRSSGIDCWYSIGLRIGGDGTIHDVLWNGPADKARFAPGQKLIAVNGEIFSPDVLRKAIREAKGNSKPMQFIVQADSFVSNADIDYHDGERYPALERVDGTPAYLDDITRPLTPPENSPAEKKEED